MPHCPEVAEALEKSIRHWRDNLAAEHPEQASTSSEDCALCAKFTSVEDDSCDGCPVSRATGEEQCWETPYYEARDRLLSWSASSSSEDAKRAWRLACEREIAFLESLRDPPVRSADE